MGVLVDYFAASGAELEGADLSAGPAAIGWPYVDCKGWLDGLAALAAELTGRDASEFGEDIPITDDDPEAESMLARVRPEVAQALAGVTDDRLARYAGDELLDDEESERNVQLRDLARSAVAGGRDVYCWSSL